VTKGFLLPMRSHLSVLADRLPYLLPLPLFVSPPYLPLMSSFLSLLNPSTRHNKASGSHVRCGPTSPRPDAVRFCELTVPLRAASGRTWRVSMKANPTSDTSQHGRPHAGADASWRGRPQPSVGAA
jgi:hypothetical protein